MLNAEQQLDIIVGGLLRQLAALMAERDALAAKVIALEAEKPKEPAAG